jgi:hypothetical protein
VDANGGIKFTGEITLAGWQGTEVEELGVEQMGGDRVSKCRQHRFPDVRDLGLKLIDQSLYPFSF